MVIFWAIEELTIRGMQFVVVLREFNVEVLDPAEFSVDVSLFGQFRVVRHPSSFNFVFIIRVKLSLWVDHDLLLVLEVLVKIHLKNNAC